LLFGIEARRKADQLEQQSIQLQAQTRAAQENEKEMKRVLVSGLLMPIGRNLHRLTNPLNAAEAVAMRQLRATPAPLRLQFLEEALRDAETARRVGRRADWVVQAIVGCDRALRADVARLVVRRIQEPGAPRDVTLACARLGLALNLAERAWAERSADALFGELRDPQVERYDYPPLAEALATVCERLPQDQAADYAAQVVDVLLTRLQDRVILHLAYEQLERAVVAMSPWLDVAAATRAARSLTTFIRQPDSHPIIWPSISRALASVCQRLPPSDSASHMNQTADFILAARDATTDKTNRGLRARSLATLYERLDAARAARVVDAVLGHGEDLQMPEALAEVAEHQDAKGSLRMAEHLVLVIQNSKANSPAANLLTPPLVSACRRLDAAGTARVSEAVVAAVRDPQTSILIHRAFARVFVVLCGQLDPARVASLEDSLVDALVADLADAKYSSARSLIAPALSLISGRPGARSAARATEALVAALRDPQTPLSSLRPLAEALAAIGRQLAPMEAALQANRAIKELGSLGVAKTAPGERASVAAALAAVWTLLGPDEAIAHARRTADELENAFRHADLAMKERCILGEALAAVCGHLAPAERVKRTNAVADALIAALPRPGTDVLTLRVLSEALAALSLSLDRAGTVRVADALLTVLGENDFRAYQYDFCEEAFKKVVARVEEPDRQRLLDHPLAVGRPQRVILDVLGEAKHRHFRNTSDYLDWAGSRGNETAVQPQDRP
jgi:hypothetical protein